MYEVFDFTSVTDLFLDEGSMHDFKQFGQSLVNLRHLNVHGLSDPNDIFKVASYLPDGPTVGIESLTISSRFLSEAPSMAELLLKANFTKRVNHTVIELPKIRRDLELFQNSENQDQ